MQHVKVTTARTPDKKTLYKLEIIENEKIVFFATSYNFLRLKKVYFKFCEQKKIVNPKKMRLHGTVEN